MVLNEMYSRGMPSTRLPPHEGAILKSGKSSQVDRVQQAQSELCVDLIETFETSGHKDMDVKPTAPNRIFKRSSSISKSLAQLRLGAHKTLKRPQNKFVDKSRSNTISKPVSHNSISKISLASLAELQQTIHASTSRTPKAGGIRTVQGIVSYSSDASELWDPASEIKLDDMKEVYSDDSDDDTCDCDCDDGNGACDHILDLQDALMSVEASITSESNTPRKNSTGTHRTLNSRAMDSLQQYKR